MGHFRALLAAVSLVASPVSAQDIPPLQLLIEELDADAARCGVSEQGIDSAVRSAARYNRLSLVKSSGYMLYVNVTVLDTTSSCAAILRVAIWGYQSAKFGQSMRLARTLFCDTGGIMIVQRNDPNGMLSTHLKQQVDRCLAKIL